MDKPPTVVVLEDGEEFEYYVEIRIYYNPDSGEWRLVTKPDQLEADPLFVRHLLTQAGSKYVESRDEERLATRKEIEALRSVAGKCPFCGQMKGDGLVKGVTQELFRKV